MPLANRIGFGMGGMVAATLGDFMYVYFLFFLTVGVGIDPVLSGTIMMVGIIWQAVLNLFIGIKSDKKRYDKDGNFVGKKRPFLLRTAIPTGAAFALLYTAVDFGPGMTIVYYLIAVFVYYVAYVSYELPYFAMAGSLTDDLDERTGIRRVATSVEYFGTFLMGVLPPFLIDEFVFAYEPHPFAWTIIGVILGGFSIILIFICCVATKGKELDLGDDEEKFNLKEALSLLKIKPYLVILLMVVMYFGYYTMTGQTFYIFMFWYGYEVIEIAAVYGIAAILGIIFVNINGKLAERHDKKKLLTGALIIGGAGSFIMSFVGLSTFGHIMIFNFTDALHGGAYWTIIWLLIYDTADLDELKGGKRREGIMVGTYSFVTMISAGIFSQVNGILLGAAGYDGEAYYQSDETMQGILEITTRWPGLLLIIAGLVIIMFPITRKKSALIMKSLERKREGKEFSVAGFEDLMR